MYRYSVDNAITYTSEDFVLFRESPFACWMERLTLESPEHGILPDRGSEPPIDTIHRQDDLADTLRTEGRRVVLVDWDLDESPRRRQTLDAMRRGEDFIVNGQLALGPLSGSSNLLMRTSGYSELGDYLYVPCDTQGKTSLHSAFRLCFLADLLHSLQGQLPPQMLIIRGDSNVVPLETENHIYHYRAVKQRFMVAMRDFRKHRMPDPAESSHFGRWSECAHEVIKQRALRGSDESGLATQSEPLEGQDTEEAGDRKERERQAVPVTAVAAGGRFSEEFQVRVEEGSTLAEQAGMLQSGAVPANDTVPGHTPNLAPVMAHRVDSTTRRRGDDKALEFADKPDEHSQAAGPLENLEFIRSESSPPVIDAEQPVELPATARSKPHPLDSAEVEAPVPAPSVVDLDSNQPLADVAVDPLPAHKTPRFSWESLQQESTGDEGREDTMAEDALAAGKPFSNSLITNESFHE